MKYISSSSIQCENCLALKPLKYLQFIHLSVLTLGFENLSLMSGNNAQARYLVGVQSIHRTPFGTNLKTSPPPSCHILGPFFFPLPRSHVLHNLALCHGTTQPTKVPNTKEIWLGGKELGTRVGWKVVFNHNNFSYCKALGQNSQCIWRAPYRYPWICFHGGEGYYAYSLKVGGILHPTCICKCKRCACKNEHSPSYTS